MNDDFRTALFSPEDAPDITRFYREIYGDNFPIKYVYDPEEIARRYDGVNHRTVVARDSENQLAGMASVFRSAPNPLVYEAGQLMVAKRHRGKGVSNIIAHALFEEYIPQIPVEAVFMEALCSHTLSQRSASSVGMIPAGVEMERLPPQGSAKDRASAPNISLLLYFRIFRDHPHTIHPHPAYAACIEQCLAELGITRTTAPGTSPDVVATEATAEHIREAGIATLTVSRIGTDWPEVLARFEADSAGCSMQVRLNLGDCAAPWAVDVLRGRKFFWGAYMPLWFQKDGILLQKLPADPDFSIPQYDTERARVLADAVRTDWEAVARNG